MPEKSTPQGQYRAPYRPREIQRALASVQRDLDSAVAKLSALCQSHADELRYMKYRASKYKKRCSDHQHKISRLRDRMAAIQTDLRHLESYPPQTDSSIQLKTRVGIVFTGVAIRFFGYPSEKRAESGDTQNDIRFVSSSPASMSR